MPLMRPECGVSNAASLMDLKLLRLSDAFSQSEPKLGFVPILVLCHRLRIERIEIIFLLSNSRFSAIARMTASHPPTTKGCAPAYRGSVIALFLHAALACFLQGRRLKRSIYAAHSISRKSIAYVVYKTSYSPFDQNNSTISAFVQCPAQIRAFEDDRRIAHPRPNGYFFSFNTLASIRIRTFDQLRAGLLRQPKRTHRPDPIPGHCQHFVIGCHRDPRTT
jgi:hypothetical protein